MDLGRRGPPSSKLDIGGRTVEIEKNTVIVKLYLPRPVVVFFLSYQNYLFRWLGVPSPFLYASA
jgi:hypothetical protein